MKPAFGVTYNLIQGAPREFGGRHAMTDSRILRIPAVNRADDISGPHAEPEMEVPE